MIFKEFYPSQMKNIIKENPKYEIIINNILKLMDEIAQSMHGPIIPTHPYLILA